MKKTLAAVAILGAFAASASADVTVYGKADLGIGYQNLDGASTWQLKSGGSGASRVGIKGSEKIGDLVVGFQYEAGFTIDNGKNTEKDGSFFSRGAHLYAKGAFGEIGAGYMGALDAATGPYDNVAGLSAMGTGYFGIGGQDYVFKNRGDRMTNAVAYKAPTFAGVTVTAQVASGTEATTDYFRKGAEFSDEVDMYYGVAAKYAAGDFGAALVVSKAQAKGHGVEDLNVTAGVNYNFGVAKAFLAANYYDDGKKGDSYGIVASVAMPLAGGELQLQAGYGEKDVAAYTTTATPAVNVAAADVKTTFAGAFYKYPLSKQTFLYGAAGWDQKDQTGGLAKEEGVADNYRAIFGMCHNF